MARLFVVATHGSEDPTRAGLAFLLVKGAIEAGHRPEVLLTGDAAVLARRPVVDALHPVGLPPLRELVQLAIDHKVPVYTWGLCARARGVAEEDLLWLNSRWFSPKEFAETAAQADRVVTF